MIRSILILTISLVLTACGSIQAPYTCIKGNDCVSYAVISETQGKGLVSSITGKTEAFKVTVYGDVSAWQITYKGQKGTATLNKGVDTNGE